LNNNKCGNCNWLWSGNKHGPRNVAQERNTGSSTKAVYMKLTGRRREKLPLRPHPCWRKRLSQNFPAAKVSARSFPGDSKLKNWNCAAASPSTAGFSAGDGFPRSAELFHAIGKLLSNRIFSTFPFKMAFPERRFDAWQKNGRRKNNEMKQSQTYLLLSSRTSKTSTKLKITGKPTTIQRQTTTLTKNKGGRRKVRQRRSFAASGRLSEH
jgi:hypothetical protein